MRVLQVSGVFCDAFGGGVGDYVCSLGTRLQGLGHEVEFLTYSHERSKRDCKGQIVHYVPLAKIPGIRYFQWGLDASKFVKRILRSTSYDLIHAHTTSMAFPLFYDSRPPLVITCHGTSSDPVHRPPQKVPLRLMERRFYERASRVVAVSQHIAQELVHRGVSERKIDVIPNGSDPKRFDRSLVNREAARKSLGIGSSQFVVLYVGGLTKRNGVSVLLEAIEHVLVQDKEGVFRFHLAGDGRLRAVAERLARLHRPVRVFGFVSEADLGTLYAASDIFVMPSLYEGMATTVLDAMTFGLPTVASDIPVHHETLAEKCGMIFDQDSAGALADAILWAESNRPQLAKMGQAASSRSKIYDWDAIATRISHVYDAVVPTGSGRDRR